MKVNWKTEICWILEQKVVISKMYEIKGSYRNAIKLDDDLIFFKGRKKVVLKEKNNQLLIGTN